MMVPHQKAVDLEVKKEGKVADCAAFPFLGRMKNEEGVNGK